MKFLLPNYSCLQNPWIGGYRPQIPALSLLCPQLNLLTPPPTNKIPGYTTGSGTHIAALILNHGTRLMWVMRFTLWLYYPERKSPLYTLNRTSVGSRTGLGAFMKRNLVLLLGIKSQEHVDDLFWLWWHCSYQDVVPHGWTVNQHCHWEFMQSLKRQVCQKRVELWHIQNCLVHHYITTALVTLSIQKF